MFFDLVSFRVENRDIWHWNRKDQHEDKENAHIHFILTTDVNYWEMKV